MIYFANKREIRRHKGTRLKDTLGAEGDVSLTKAAQSGEVPNTGTGFRNREREIGVNRSYE